MPSVALINEDTGKVLTNLAVGEHIIGRGPLLECTDQRVSRNFGVIRVTESGDTYLTAVHINPCFYLSRDDSNVRVLEKNEPVHLADGDRFGLLSDQYWYKIRILSQDDAEIIENADNASVGDAKETNSKTCKSPKLLNVNTDNTSIGDAEETSSKVSKPLKRSIVNTSLNEPPIKKVKNVSENKKPKASSQNETVTNFKNKNATSLKSKNVANSQNESPPASPQNSGVPEEEHAGDEENLSINEYISSGDSDIGDKDNGGDSKDRKCTSVKKPSQKIRDRCWYGDSCYRKNPKHREEFSHPGDSDYDSDSQDCRPVCPDGDRCQRKDKAHGKQYKHPRRHRLRRMKREERRSPSGSDVSDSDISEPFQDSSEEFDVSNLSESTDEYDESQEND